MSDEQAEQQKRLVRYQHLQRADYLHGSKKALKFIKLRIKDFLVTDDFLQSDPATYRKLLGIKPPVAAPDLEIL